MNAQELNMILKRLKIDTSQIQKSRKVGQVLVPCPLAPWLHKGRQDENPSCSINFGNPTRPTLFQCFACKESGKFWQLVQSVGVFSDDESLQLLALEILKSDEPSLSTQLASISEGFDDWVYSPEKSGKLTELDDSVLNRFPSAWNHLGAQGYLLSRASPIDFDRAAFWDLRYDAHQNRVFFPVRTKTNKLVGAVGRALTPNDPRRYYNYFGFESGSTLGGIHAITGQKKVAVVEGFFDLVNTYPWFQDCGYDVVCTWKADLSEFQADLLLGLDASIHFFYDLDPAGDLGWKKAESLLRKMTFGLRRATWKNISLDPGAFTKQDLSEAIESV